MCLTEFNEAETFQALADDYFAEGIARGKAEALAGLVEDGLLTSQQAADQLRITVPAFRKLAAGLKKQKVEL